MLQPCAHCLLFSLSLICNPYHDLCTRWHLRHTTFAFHRAAIMCAIILKEKTIAQKIGIHLFRFVHKSVVKILFRSLSHFLLSDLVYFYYISSISYLYNLDLCVCVCEREFFLVIFVRYYVLGRITHMVQSMRQLKCMRDTDIGVFCVLLAFLLLVLLSLLLPIFRSWISFGIQVATQYKKNGKCKRNRYIDRDEHKMHKWAKLHIAEWF